MITPAAQVKILDFGLAKRLPLSDETLPTVSRESQGGGVAGTPGYIAPEVLLGQEADYRSDIFSLEVWFSTKCWLIDILSARKGLRTNRKASCTLLPPSRNRFLATLDSGTQYAEAKKLYLETFEAQRRVLGAEHAETLTTMHSLGNPLR
jgi:serine/threonine protein kinase